MDLGIVRTLSKEEKQSMQELGEVTAKDIFNKKIAEVSQEFVKAHRPFDERCARLDFMDKLEKVQKESERKFGYVREKDVEELDFGNFEEYGDIDRFELVEDAEDMQDKVIEGVRTQVVIGHTLKWRCKLRGHYVSVFMPMKDYEEWVKNRKEKSKKKEEK